MTSQEAVCEKTDSTQGAEGEVKAVVGGAPTVKVGYDGSYRVSSVADGKNQTTQMTYDRVGNQTRMDYPDGIGKIEWTQFDKIGNPLQTKDGRGQVANYTRLASNNAITNVSYPGSDKDNITYKYDIYGHITEARNNNGIIRYRYDNADNLNDESVFYNTGNTGSQAPGYEGMERLNPDLSTIYYLDGAVQYNSAREMRYFYDAAGRMTQASHRGEWTIWTQYTSGLQVV